MSEKMFNQTRGGKRRIQRRSQKKNRPRFIEWGGEEREIDLAI